VDLLKGSTSIKEVKRIANNTYGDKALKMRAIYKILNQIKTDNNTYNKRKFNSKKTFRTAALIAAFATDVEADRRICVKTLASAYGTSADTIFSTLHKDFGLVKRSAQVAVTGPDGQESRDLS
jgi:hypothetical protein